MRTAWALLLLDFQISQVLSGKVQPRPGEESAGKENKFSLHVQLD